MSSEEIAAAAQNLSQTLLLGGNLTISQMKLLMCHNTTLILGLLKLVGELQGEMKELRGNGATVPREPCGILRIILRLLGH
jgi:hypothetical protein